MTIAPGPSLRELSAEFGSMTALSQIPLALFLASRPSKPPSRMLRARRGWCGDTTAWESSDWSGFGSSRHWVFIFHVFLAGRHRQGEGGRQDVRRPATGDAGQGDGVEGIADPPVARRGHAGPRHRPGRGHAEGHLPRHRAPGFTFRRTVTILTPPREAAPVSGFGGLRTPRPRAASTSAGPPRPGPRPLPHRPRDRHQPQAGGPPAGERGYHTGAVPASLCPAARDLGTAAPGLRLRRHRPSA